MVVFIVQEVIDLGDHVISVHFKEEDAQKVVDEMQAQYAALYRSDKTYFYCDAHEVV